MRITTINIQKNIIYWNIYSRVYIAIEPTRGEMKN